MASSQFDNKRFFAVASILSALLTLLLVVSAAPPPGSAGDLLPYFRAHQPRFVILAVAVLAWVVVSLPVVIAIARLVGHVHPVLASAGAVLSAGGYSCSASGHSFSSALSSLLLRPTTQRLVQYRLPTKRQSGATCRSCFPIRVS